MSSLCHARLPIALVAFVLAIFPLSAIAATERPDDVAPDLIAAEDPNAEAPPISVEPAPSDKGDAGASGEVPVDDPNRGKIKVGPTIIDQYPQNPRCYVGGRYVPAPPLCPN